MAILWFAGPPFSGYPYYSLEDGSPTFLASNLNGAENFLLLDENLEVVTREVTVVYPNGLTITRTEPVYRLPTASDTIIWFGNAIGGSATYASASSVTAGVPDSPSTSVNVTITEVKPVPGWSSLTTEVGAYASSSVTIGTVQQATLIQASDNATLKIGTVNLTTPEPGGPRQNAAIEIRDSASATIERVTGPGDVFVVDDAKATINNFTGRGEVNVRDNASLTSSGSIGVDADDNYLFRAIGSSAKFNFADELSVGQSGIGFLQFDGTANQTFGSVIVGRNATGVGVFSAVDANLTITTDITVGKAAVGRDGFSGGDLSTLFGSLRIGRDLKVAEENAATGDVTLLGTNTTVGGSLTTSAGIGSRSTFKVGSGQLTIEGSATIGKAGTSNADASFPQIYDGGKLIIRKGLGLGEAETGIGGLSVAGVNSSLTVTEAAKVGLQGQGLIRVGGGATFTSAGLELGTDVLGTGRFRVTGIEDENTGSFAGVAKATINGNVSAGGLGSGIIRIDNGGELQVNGSISIGKANLSKLAAVILDGTQPQNTIIGPLNPNLRVTQNVNLNGDGAALMLSREAVASIGGDLTVEGALIASPRLIGPLPGFVSTPIIVGASSAVEVSSGGSLTVGGNVVLAQKAGSEVSLEVSSASGDASSLVQSKLTITGNLNAGENGTAKIDVTEGGVLSIGETLIAGTDGRAQITVDGVGSRLEAKAMQIGGAEGFITASGRVYDAGSALLMVKGGASLAASSLTLKTNPLDNVAGSDAFAGIEVRDGGSATVGDGPQATGNQIRVNATGSFSGHGRIVAQEIINEGNFATQDGALSIVGDLKSPVALKLNDRAPLYVEGSFDGTITATPDNINPVLYIDALKDNSVTVAASEVLPNPVTIAFKGQIKNNIFGSMGRENVFGGRGNDTIDGGGGADSLRGGEGDDELDGGGGDDTIYGLWWEDQFLTNQYIEKGNNVIQGGAGIDSVYYWYPAPVYRLSVYSLEKVIAWTTEDAPFDKDTNFKLKVAFSGDESTLQSSEDTLAWDVELVSFFDGRRNIDYTLTTDELQGIASEYFALSQIAELGSIIIPIQPQLGGVLYGFGIIGGRIVNAEGSPEGYRGLFIQLPLAFIDAGFKAVQLYLDKLKVAPGLVENIKRVYDEYQDVWTARLNELYNGIVLDIPRFFKETGEVTDVLMEQLKDILREAKEFVDDKFKPSIELFEVEASAIVPVEVPSLLDLFKGFNAAPLVGSNTPNQSAEAGKSVPITEEFLGSGITDSDGDTLLYRQLKASVGELVENPSAGWTLLVPDGFSGEIVLEYLVTDGVSEPVVAKAIVSVTPPVGNTAPVADADGPYAAPEDGTLTVSAAIGVLLGDADLEGGLLVAELVASTTNGALILNADGSFSYSPDENFNGADSFVYRAVDQGGLRSEPVTVLINVTPINDAPTAPSTNSVTTLEDSVSAAISIGAVDVDDAAISYGLKSGAGPAKGTVSFDQDAGTFIYTPGPNVQGIDEFTIVIEDDQGAFTEQVVSVTVIPVNDPATITGSATGAVSEDGTLVTSGVLVVTDVDAGEGGFNGPSALTGTYGTFAFAAATGVWSYTLNNAAANVQALTASDTRTDSITVTSLDNTASQTITVTVRGTDDASIVGQPGQTTVNGTNGSDIITLLPSNLVANAGSGDDIIVLTSSPVFQAHVLRGGNGTDTLDLSSATSGVAVNLAFGLATGGAIGLSVLDSIENVVGSPGNDNLRGSGANNRIDGNEGNDFIAGGARADYLLGGFGIDTIAGGGGNDTIEGGSGNDILTGGSGEDVFVFKPGFGNDRITDFDPIATGGQDFLQLLDFGITRSNFAQRVAITDAGNDTLVTIDGDLDQTIRLASVGNSTSVTVDDFKFL